MTYKSLLLFFRVLWSTGEALPISSVRWCPRHVKPSIFPTKNCWCAWWESKSDRETTKLGCWNNFFCSNGGIWLWDIFTRFHMISLSKQEIFGDFIVPCWGRFLSSDRQRFGDDPTALWGIQDQQKHRDWNRNPYMDVSETRVTPKSSISIGFSIINHAFWGTPIFGNAHIYNNQMLQTNPDVFFSLWRHLPFSNELNW